MFGWFGSRRREIDRTLAGLTEVARILEMKPPGFVALTLADDDFDGLRVEGGPTPEQIRRLNFQMLAAAYMLKFAKDRNGEAGFTKALSPISAALCQALGFPKQREREVRDQVAQYFADWEPYLRAEEFLDEALKMPSW